MSVLVACCTYAGKEPALDEWVAAYRALTYTDTEAFMVDNTLGSAAYAETVRSKGIPCAHVFPSPGFMTTYRRCWELILSRAVEGGHYWVYSVEADNIPAPESLDVLLDWAINGHEVDGEMVGGLELNTHLVTHSYPLHSTPKVKEGSEDYMYHEMGCLLTSRSLLERAMAEWDEFGNVPRALFECCDRYEAKHVYLDNVFEVKHLDTYETEFAQFPKDDAVLADGLELFCPYAELPDDYGTKVPPSLR